MLFFVHHDSFLFFTKFWYVPQTFIYLYFMVICKIGWSIRSWLSDYISFSFYKSYCRHDIYWILVALIKVSRLYGLCRHLYTQLIYWHCAVILYTHVNLLNKRFWILNPDLPEYAQHCTSIESFKQNYRMLRLTISSWYFWVFLFNSFFAIFLFLCYVIITLLLS